MSKAYDELNDIHENSGDFYSRVTLHDRADELATLRAENAALKQKNESLTIAVSMVRSIAKEALK